MHFFAFKTMKKLHFFPFQNISKDLDPSFKMDLDFWNCLEGKQLCLIIEEVW